MSEPNERDKEIAEDIFSSTAEIWEKAGVIAAYRAEIEARQGSWQELKAWAVNEAKDDIPEGSRALSFTRLVAQINEIEARYKQGEGKDPNRCAVCGWPLANSSEDGCVRGNCSMRPRPERLYDAERAAKEAQSEPAQAEPSECAQAREAREYVAGLGLYIDDGLKAEPSEDATPEYYFNQIINRAKEKQDAWFHDWAQSGLRALRAAPQAAEQTLGLARISSEAQETRLASCETALAERDAEIVRLRAAPKHEEMGEALEWLDVIDRYINNGGPLPKNRDDPYYAADRAIVALRDQLSQKGAE